MRRTAVLVALIATLALIVGACQQAATQAPTQAPTSSATDAPTDAPTSAPTDAPTSAPTDAPTTAPTDAPTTEPSPGAVTCDTPLRVGLVTDVGRVNDKGFNQSAYEGMLAAQTAAPTCFETDYIETVSQSDYQANIAQFTDAGYDVVIGVGFLLGNDLGDAAAENAETIFISVDGIPGEGHDSTWFTNGESLFFAEDQAGYLAGVLAASMTETDHIGVVGGLLVVPPVELFVEGYINGARSVNPDITVDFVYTTSFVDPPQGSNAAQQMLDQGADVIFAAGGLTGNGALSAACERRAGGDNVWAIGVDTDQFETLPEVQDCLLSSATKNIVGALRDSLLRIASGEFAAGVHVDNASTGGIGLAPFHNFEGDVPQDVRDLLDQTYQGLADGSIETGAVVDQNTVVPDSGPIVP